MFVFTLNFPIFMAASQLRGLDLHGDKWILWEGVLLDSWVLGEGVLLVSWG